MSCCKSRIDRLLESRSDWYSLKKDIAWIYLRHKILNQVIPELGQPLSVQELEAAEVAIVKYIQQGMKGVTFSASGFNVEKSSAVNKLDPYVSRHGILCVGGRLHNAQLDDRSKHPYILPKEAYVCSLIVKDIHVHSGHAGREHVLALLREKFWIVGARAVVRKVLKQCFHCKRVMQTPAMQKMADLPTDRITSDKPPFSYVGVDYFGPFMVKRGRSQVKRYGCIFTCLVIRAIHIEISHSLDTDSFINALQRFMART